MGRVAWAKSFHESFHAAEGVPLPSDRSTGLVFTAVAVIVAAGWRNVPVVPWAALGVAAVLATLSFRVPWVLRPLNLVWFRFGLLLHRVVNPVVMLAMFVAVFLPAGLLMRIWNDPLQSRRARSRTTYWIDRTPEAQRPGDQGGWAVMSNQF